jgi:Rod binding domain-containing protein
VTVTPLNLDITANHGHVADTPEKIRGAASQFEALLIGEVLKTARSEDDGGWMGSGDDPSAASAMDVATDYFARALASQGGLGLSRMIADGLDQKAASSSNPSIPPEPPAGTPTSDR